MQHKQWIAAALVLSCAGAHSVYAQDRSIVCESIDNGRNSCSLRTDGHVRMVEQISKAPCIKHQSWDVEDGGIWVSNGCRARFEVVERDNRDDRRGGDDDRRDAPPPPPPPAEGASARLQAKCAHRVADYRRISPDDAIPQGSRAVDDGVFEVTIGTPQGPMVCTVDRDGNVRGVNEGQ